MRGPESVNSLYDRVGEPRCHVREWDEPNCSAIPPEVQFHHARAAASYTSQLHERALAWPREVRYGAGRPSD